MLSEEVKLNIVVTYNLKRGQMLQNEDDEAEFDDMETVQKIARAIEALGHSVTLIEANKDLVSKIQHTSCDMVFNFAEGLKGRGREAQVPALLNLLGIFFTGSDETTLAVSLDKALCKRVLGFENVNTPKFELFTSKHEVGHKKMKFPMIVKPNAEGSSKGINDASVVYNEEELKRAVENLTVNYHADALVEEYIAGREFTVGVLGNGESIEVLPIMEICFIDDETKFYSYRVKKNAVQTTKYVCPAETDEKLRKKLEKAAKKIFRVLECRDLARMDFRVDAEGNVYFIEINPLPGLVDGYSDLTLIAKAAGMSYESLIQRILNEALKRTQRDGESQ